MRMAGRDSFSCCHSGRRARTEHGRSAGIHGVDAEMNSA